MSATTHAQFGLNKKSSTEYALATPIGEGTLDFPLNPIASKEGLVRNRGTQIQTQSNNGIRSNQDSFEAISCCPTGNFLSSSEAW